MQLSRIAADMTGSGVSGSAPKYLRLSNAILNLIEAGEMRPGDKLPPEGALAGALPASLGTVQKALGHLKHLGVVVRDHGRGTFVAGAPRAISGERMPEGDLLHFRFADDDHGALLPVYARVETVEKVAGSKAGATTPWARFLGSDRAYIRIGRSINVNHEFEAFSQFYLPCERHIPARRVEQNIQHADAALRPTPRVCAAAIGCMQGVGAGRRQPGDGVGNFRQNLSQAARIVSTGLFAHGTQAYRNYQPPLTNTKKLRVRAPAPDVDGVVGPHGQQRIGLATDNHNNR
jgi:hypothetical protein